MELKDMKIGQNLVVKTMADSENKRVVSARMNPNEISFLRKLGTGDLSEGIRVAMQKAGYQIEKEHFKGYRVIRELTSQGAKYSLYLNEKITGIPLAVSDSIFNALEARHGTNFVMEDVIVKSFVNLPKEVEIDKVYDLSGDVVWSKYS